MLAHFGQYIALLQVSLRSVQGDGSRKGRSMATHILSYPGRPFPLFVLRSNDSLDVPANVEVALNPELERVTSSHEVFEYAVDDVLVKYSRIAIGINVELQRFELDTSLVGDIPQIQSSEIRKIRKWANRGEFA